MDEDAIRGGARLERRGKKVYSDEEKEAAVALYHNKGSIRAVSLQTGIARSTLRKWIQQSTEHQEKPVTESKMTAACMDVNWRKNGGNGDILRCARAAMADALVLLQRRVQTALRAQDELDALLTAIREDGDMPQKERVETAKAIAKMAQPEMRDMMNAINSIYERMKDMEAAEKGKPDLSGLSTEEIRSILALNGCASTD